ncbi:MAG: hypothetical protein NZP34_14150, partial [Caldilineales bacterium]|nr:hypothetical protein [Caldilineales bacterium]
ESAGRVAQAMEGALAALPHWMANRRQEGDLRARLYKALIAIGVHDDVVAWADAILNLLRRAAE